MQFGIVFKRILFLSAIMSAIGIFSSISAQNCFEYDEPITLTGRLYTKIFPGPPNYESFRKGDSKSTALLVSLSNKICLKAGDVDSYEIPENNIRVVQLVITDEAQMKMFKMLRGKQAILTGTLFHQHTGHHYTKILLEVTSIEPAR